MCLFRNAFEPDAQSAHRTWLRMRLRTLDVCEVRKKRPFSTLQDPKGHLRYNVR